MPWKVVEDNPECSGYAVVKSDTGELVACHDTQESAQAQVRALYANVPEERSQPEFRSVAFIDIDASADGSKFDGYAAVFDESADLGQYTESVQRGSFRKALAQQTNVPMLYQHNDELPALGTTKAGTLALSEDAKGLRVKAHLGHHFVAEAVREMIRRNEIDGMSYGFVAGRGNSKIEHRGGRVHRTLTGFKKLLDVSPTWDPAYARTGVELRSMTSMAVDLQQLLEGEDQQLEDGAETTDPETVEEESGSGAIEQRSIAARKRALQLLIHETGGTEHADQA